MANKIKGLTIEIGGETTGLQKALGEVNKNSRDLKSELREVDRLLKLDPKNTELVAQKQKILAEAVENSKKKLDTLKEAERQAQEQFKRGEIGEDQYRAIQREVIKAEQNLKSLEGQLDEVNNKWKKAGERVKEFGDKTSELGKKMAPASAAAAGMLAGIVGLTVKSGQAADEINTLAKQTGLSTEEIQKFQYASELIDVPLETLVKSMAKMTKSMQISKEAQDMGRQLTGAALAFEELGVNVLDAEGKLRSNDDVFAETIKLLGEMENETQRDAYAMQIFGRSALELNPLILGGADALKELGDEAEEMGLILSQEALDDLNEFNDEIDKTKAVVSAAGAKVGHTFGEILLPIIQDVAEWLQDLAEWFGNLDPTIAKTILVVLGIVAALAPFLAILGKVASGIGVLIKILPVIKVAISALLGPVGLVVAAIAAVIAIGVLLYKNWDKIKEKAGQLGKYIKEKFNAIKEAIMTPIRNAVSFVKEQIEKIKGFFNFKVSLPKIKLPHFSITPKGWGLGDLLKGKIPKLGISWYAEGGIFSSPSIIGVGEGKSKEAVIPIDKLPGMIAEALKKANGVQASPVITGNNFYVREESDIRKVALELYNLQLAGARARGGR